MRKNRIILGIFFAFIGLIGFFFAYLTILDRNNPNAQNMGAAFDFFWFALGPSCIVVSIISFLSIRWMSSSSKELEALLENTYAAWRNGVLSEIIPTCQEAAKGSFNRFLGQIGLVSSARAFANSYSPNAGEFMIQFANVGWIRRVPEYVLTNERIVVWADRTGSESVNLYEIEAIKTDCGWTQTLHITKSGGQNLKFQHVSVNERVLAWAIARTRLKLQPSVGNTPRIRSKQATFAPGDYLPNSAWFPWKGAWHVIAWLLGGFVGLIAGGIVAWRLPNSGYIGSYAPIVGFIFFGFISKDVRQSLIRGRGLAHYKKMLAKQVVDDPDICVQLGLYSQIRDEKSAAQIDESDSYFLRALKQYPGHRDATICLAASLLADNKPRKANPGAVIELLEPWLNDHEDFMGEYLLANAHKALSGYTNTKAVDHFRRILESYPTMPEPIRKEIMDFLTSEVLRKR